MEQYLITSPNIDMVDKVISGRGYDASIKLSMQLHSCLGVDKAEYEKTPWVDLRLMLDREFDEETLKQIIAVKDTSIASLLD